MKRVLGSKFSAKIFSEFVKIKKTDRILVFPICTMTVYVDDYESWLHFYGKNGRMYNKIVAELQLLGASSENVLFFNYIDGLNSIIDINSYEYLIIPGGDAELGLRRLQELKLIDEVINYTGDIIAYSAGALMLFKHFFLSPNWYYKKMKYVSGLNIPSMPDCIIEVHYDHSDEMRDNVLKAVDSIGKDCIMIGDCGVLCYNSLNDELYLSGDVTYEKYGRTT